MRIKDDLLAQKLTTKAGNLGRRMYYKTTTVPLGQQKKNYLSLEIVLGY